MYRAVYILCIAILSWSSIGVASEDNRFTVTLPLEGKPPTTWQSRVDDGMAVVLDRVLLRSERQHAALKGARYLLRATPMESALQLQFRSTAIVAALQRRGLHPIMQTPHINLQLSMRSADGVSLPQTTALLRQAAEELANHWGVSLEQDAGQSRQSLQISLKWRWIDDHWLSLTVDSAQVELAALSGAIPVDAEQPVDLLREQLSRIMLRARELGAKQQQSTPLHNAASHTTTAPKQQVIISIIRAARLAEQVGLEQVLRAVPQVKGLTPLLLGSREQRYQLLVTDEEWIAPWFANRGMHAVMTTDGWSVQ
ncbi:MAG: hypothetical protein Q9M13_01180 [Mariprofundales bacterium]|nr:hypothetical protein [Mariprofundales bacterium]